MALIAPKFIVSETAAELGIGSEILRSQIRVAVIARRIAIHCLRFLGYTQAAIADELGISDATVSAHCRSELDRLQVAIRDAVLDRCERRWGLWQIR